MSSAEWLSSTQNYEEFPGDDANRHTAFADVFGEFLLGIRNWSLDSSQNLIESEEARAKLGTIRREYYEGVAKLSKEDQAQAMLLTEETLNGFCERLLWFMGGLSNDLRLGNRHAFRVQVEIEVIEDNSKDAGEVLETKKITKDGRFFGDYWGRWLNRFGKKSADPE